MQETQFRFLGGEDPLERAWQPTPVFLPGEPHEQRAWGATARGVTESQTRLSNVCVRCAGLG